MRRPAARSVRTIVALLVGVSGAACDGRGEREPDEALPPEVAAAGPRDTTVEERVVASLASERRLAGEDIDVRVRDGIATLSGEVGDPALVDLAATVAHRDPDVDRVERRLLVNASASVREAAPPDDAALAEDVAETLSLNALKAGYSEPTDAPGRWRIRGASFAFTVEAHDGAVSLSGTAPTVGDLDRIRQAVRSIPGVRRVEIDLSVVPVDDGADVKLGRGPGFVHPR